MEIIHKPKNKLKWLLLIAPIFFIIFGLAISAVVLAQKYENKIYPGIKIAGINVSGLTKTQAINLLDDKFKQIYGSSEFTAEKTTKAIINQDDILKLNTESLINKAFQIGRDWQYPLLKKEINLDYRIDKVLLKNKLQETFQAFETPGQNSEIVLNVLDKDKRIYELSFSDSKIGLTFDYDQAIETLSAAIPSFQNPNIQLIKLINYPAITQMQAEKQRQEIEQLLALSEIKLIYQDKNWTINWADFSHWIELGLDEQRQPSVKLNEAMVNGQLTAIAQEINRPALDAKFQIKNNRVIEFQASGTGLALNIEQSQQKISDFILKTKNPTINLIVDVIIPQIQISNINDLGIKEKIGEGFSNFSGSPQNRRHNIGIGAATLNGILIKPDEEFSLVKAIGEVDAEHGYKPELVIKKDGTKPEFGGGLCQIGTTMFRAALASGLPITARVNHSYRVVYYEPAGLDATIYNPYPDFKFINDTGNYILIQSKLIGNNLTFEFWGKLDSRQIRFEGQNQTTDLKQLKPNIFNITTPGPAKEIETTELAPGVKKQTEKPHNGADTVFYRYIVKPDGTEKKETWKSHYVPWQAVFLIGVDTTTPVQTKQIEKIEEEMQ